MRKKLDKMKSSDGIRLWKNKTTKQIVQATPWWEIVDPILSDKDLLAENLIEGRKFKIGTLIQIGWLIKNKNDVWFGTGISVAEHFKDIGPWKGRRSK